MRRPTVTPRPATTPTATPRVTLILFARRPGMTPTVTPPVTRFAMSAPAAAWWTPTAIATDVAGRSKRRADPVDPPFGCPIWPRRDLHINAADPRNLPFTADVIVQG